MSITLTVSPADYNVNLTTPVTLTGTREKLQNSKVVQSVLAAYAAYRFHSDWDAEHSADRILEGETNIAHRSEAALDKLTQLMQSTGVSIYYA